VEEDTKRWYWLAIGIAGMVMAGLIVWWQQCSGGGASLMDRLNSAMIAVEEAVTGERSEPTARAGMSLEADLGTAVNALLVKAEADGYGAYREFATNDCPSAIQDLNPVAVRYFDSKSHPDGVGVLFVLERHRDWDAGVLIYRQRNSEWQGVHLNGQIMSAGPDFGFRRLHKVGIFWHWYRRSWAATNKTELGVLRGDAGQTRKGAP
jgi:hypothetical protein